MDLNELKKLINEELEKNKKHLDEQDKTALGRTRPETPKALGASQQPVPDEETNIDIPEKEIKPEVSNIPLNNLLNLAISEQDFKKLDQETQNALQTVFRSVNLLKTAINPLAVASIKNKNVSWDLLEYIGEITKKISILTKQIPTEEPSAQQKTISSMPRRGRTGYESKPTEKTATRLPGRPGPHDVTKTITKPTDQTVIGKMRKKFGFEEE